MEYLILGGLIVNLGLNWWEIRKVQTIEEVLGNMLYDLGKKGVLDVEITEDD
jgi:hypothetical protein